MTSKGRENGFDPVARLSTLEDGSQYLGARDRLLWFLHEEDEYSVTSQVERVSSQLAIVKVTVTLGSGKKVEALGSAQTNGDYRAVESAETHALARALALLGYGTESALEMDTKAVSDSPSRPQKKGNGTVDEDGPNGSMQALTPLAILAPPDKASSGIKDASGENTGLPAREDRARERANGREAQQTIHCSDCQGVIKQGKLRDGTVLTAREVAERSRKRFNRPLCARCLIKQMVQERPKEAKAV